jgi:hypothetical protein
MVVAIALLAIAPAAEAQFGIVRNDDPFQDGWIAQTFADDGRIATEAYSNSGGGDHDPYPIAGTGTGVYDLAGGHPFIGVTDFSVRRASEGGPPAGGNVKTVRVDIPPGLVPNPKAFVRCSDEDLTDSDCPVSSQIGTEEITLYLGLLDTLTGNGDVRLRVPLYNMTPLSNPEDAGPRQDVVARFGFNPAEAAEAVGGLPPIPGLPNLLPGIVGVLLGLDPVHIVGGVRDAPSEFGPADYGLYFTIDHLPAYDSSSQTSPGVLGTNLSFWGVPGDVGNDAQRGRACAWIPADSPLPVCPLLPQAGTAPAANLPFLTTPTRCTGASLVTGLNVWSHTGERDQVDDSTPAVVDVDDGLLKKGAQECLSNVPVDGGVELAPGATTPDSPAGAEVKLTVPPGGLADKGEFATSHVKDVAVTLPPGMTINPSAANGLEACSDEQLAVNAGEVGGEACPAASRIGDVRVITPLLPPAAGDPPDSTPVMTGSAYVGQPLEGDKYRLFLTIEGRLVSIRLKGSVKPDSSTGQLTATFKDNPELPFDELAVDLRDGPRAPLATPLDCGSTTAAARLTPWSGSAPIDRASLPFEIAGDGCPVGFQPTFGASTASAVGGAFSPLTVNLGRDDRNQFLSGVRVDTPPGLAAEIKGVEQCSGAAANSGACPAASRIGAATTTAGAGSEPYRLSGPVYFTEGYKGAPFGMVAVIRAIAGPYDLGTVVVRQSIFVDPEDAHLTVVSDPLPQILEGVPIRLRNVDVALDKPGFTYNPTSCGAKEIRGRLHSIQGTAVDRGAGLQFDDCQRLGFSPKTRMRLTGPRQLRLGGHPGLRVGVTQPGSQANIAKAVVKLPRSLALDPNNAQAVCGYEAGLRADCPRKTRIGWATAISPVLNEKLAGPVYFVQGIRVDPNTGARIRTLPSLLAKLNGEVRINLRGTTEVDDRDRLVSTFASVPDAPVSRFDVRLKGGKGGVLAATGRPRLCGRRQISLNGLVGHNGKPAAQRRVRIATAAPCRKLRRLQAKAKQRKAAQRRRAASRRAAS